MALGAETSAVVWLFARRAMLPLGIGLAIGAGGALAMGRLIRSFLIEASAADPVTMTAIAGLLAAVCAAACFFPARGAARLEPATALRYE